MKKILTVFLFLIFSICVMAFNFSVAPTKFSINLKKISTNEVILINNTSSPMRLDTYLEAPEGYKNFNLNEGIKIYPKMIAIKPGGKQIVRFRVKPIKFKENGEYKSYIVFKEIPLKNNKSNKNNNELDVQLKMITEVGISVYGYYGNIVKDIEVSNIKVKYENKNLIVKIDTLSKGNSSEEIGEKIELLDGAGKVIDTKEVKVGRTMRNGKVTLESNVEVSNEKVKAIRVIIVDSNDKIYAQKKINI